jgi:hypothetical protein
MGMESDWDWIFEVAAAAAAAAPGPAANIGGAGGRRVPSSLKLAVFAARFRNL